MPLWPAVVAGAATIGWLLSLATARVANWFVMTDELYYVRLAVSVAQTGSPLPRLHGEIVGNVNQLYPVLLAPLFGHNDMPGSLADAHRLNAFLFASAAVPVYLLARYAGVPRVAAAWAGVLAAVVPWAVLASFVLTESVAYPAFCWAVLALVAATSRRTHAHDALALAALALAVLARVQFLVLAPVLTAAVVADALHRAGAAGYSGRALLAEAGRELLRRRVLLGAHVLALVAVVAAAAAGGPGRLLGAYAVTAQELRLDVDLAALWTQHLAVLALGLALAPFLLASAWLVDRVRAAADEHRALALVGLGAVLAVSVQVASFDQRFGAGLVKDRYLFYLAPVLLVALAAALAVRPWPRWRALVPPTVVCAVGFALYDFPRYEKLNADSPLALLNDEVVRLATSPGWAAVLLAGAAVLAAVALLEGMLFLPRRALAVAVAAVVTVALPAQLANGFYRLFAVPGTNGLPVDLDQGVVFNWIDRFVAPADRVTYARFPFDVDYWAGVAYWWDVEFWNESVVREVAPGRASPGPEPWLGELDRRTGAILRWPETRYFLSHESDIRLRLAGDYATFERGAYLIDTERPWRAAWATEGTYGDGWTRPHVPARIHVFPQRSQRQPLVRFLTVRVVSPDDVASVAVTLSSNEEQREESLPPGGVLDATIRVCVPAGGPGHVGLRTPNVTDVHRDASRAPLTGERDRPVGVLLRRATLADEAEPAERCKA